MNILTALFIATTIQLNLPKDLLHSLCFIETKHNVKAIAYNDGVSNSYGICQIKLETAKELGFKGDYKKLMLPENNIYYAGLYLQKQINRYNSVQRGVIAYNRGNAKGLTKSNYQVKVYNHWRRIDE
jgi:soluble lytic murein transglycosylase-like protein